MRIAVCDDEKSGRDVIAAQLASYTDEYDIRIEEFESGTEVLRAFASGRDWDVVYMDIEMEEVSGIGTIRTLKDRGSAAIFFFVTAHVGYVSETFRLGAFQFLTKPFSAKDFDLDFRRAAEAVRMDRSDYVIRWKDTFNTVKCSDILFMEQRGRHLVIRTKNGEYECVGSIAKEIDKLHCRGFSRCHQGYIVNLKWVTQAGRDTAVVSNSIEVPVSRGFRKGFMEDYGRHLNRVTVG